MTHLPILRSLQPADNITTTKDLARIGPRNDGKLQIISDRTGLSGYSLDTNEPNPKYYSNANEILNSVLQKSKAVLRRFEEESLKDQGSRIYVVLE